MSRHKLVKNLDLGEELDDYDGADPYDDDEDGAGEDTQVVDVRLLLTTWNLEISPEDRGDSRLRQSRICLNPRADTIFWAIRAVTARHCPSPGPAGPYHPSKRRGNPGVIMALLLRCREIRQILTKSVMVLFRRSIFQLTCTRPEDCVQSGYEEEEK